jgi:hypothetical protein
MAKQVRTKRVEQELDSSYYQVTRLFKEIEEFANEHNVDLDKVSFDVDHESRWGDSFLSVKIYTDVPLTAEELKAERAANKISKAEQLKRMQLRVEEAQKDLDRALSKLKKK